MTEEIGTVVSTLLGPSPTQLDFVVTKGIAHRGQFVEVSYTEGTMICLITNLIKTNRYFERADSVKEFEATGAKIFEQFPTTEWEYLVAQTRPLGVFHEGKVKRSSYPPSPGAKVKIATAENLKKFLGFDEENGLLLGEVEYHSLPVKLNLTRLLRKHLAVLAMSGSGKCVSPCTKILLSNGEEREIGLLVDEKLSSGFEKEDGVEFCRNLDEKLKVFAINEKSQIVESSVLAFSRRKAPQTMFRVFTQTGKTLELTPEHLAMVLNGSVGWVQAKDLVQGDYLFLPKPEINGASNTIEVCHYSKRGGFSKTLAVDADFARLFGLLLAEGHNNGKMFSFTNNSCEIRAEFSRLCKKVLGVEAKRLKRENELRVYNKELALALQGIGFTNSSWTKFVPKELSLSGKEVFCAFLSALIDCDGYISKQSGLEVCLASKGIIDSINSMFLRLGIVPILKQKKAMGRIYSRLSVSSAKDLCILSRVLDLLVDYKKENLAIIARRKHNPNICVIPGINENLKRVVKLLNMSFSQTKSTAIANYISRPRKDNPSFESLQGLCFAFEERAALLESKIMEAKKMFSSLPDFFEGDAKQLISRAYGVFDFVQISNGTGVSATTARRIVRNITVPTRNAFVLAKQVLELEGKSNSKVNSVLESDFKQIAAKIKSLCEAMGFETQAICKEANLNKNYLYSVAEGGEGGTYSKLYSVAETVLKNAQSLEQKLTEAIKEIDFLKSLAFSRLFFDKTIKIEEFKPNFEYVYDLSTEHGNFTANHLIIHNSYFVSVMLEELLSRKKEQGRIAIVLLDVHGEYSSFAETLPASDSKHSDYSRHSKIVRARDIRIGVSKLSVGMLSGIIPGLSAQQKRDLGKVISKLQREMRSGLGPYDLNSIKTELNADEGIKENTRMALLSWLYDLDDLHLFEKTDEPSINDLVKPGQLTIIDLSDIINVRKKQIIISYFGQKLFSERRMKRLPPFLMVLEESHQFCPERASAETAISRSIIRTISREGRKFGASICLISQRPIQLDTTTLANCNTHIILRITNPYDLDHIGKGSESLDKGSLDMITSLRVGEALIVGEATNYPVFFKVRERKSLESRHEMPLEKAALDFEEGKTKEEKETEEFL